LRIRLAFAASLLLAHAAYAESITLRNQEQVIIEIAGVTAAWTTNPEIAEVTTAGNRLSVAAHSAGTTHLTVITAGGTQTFLITVAAAFVRSAVRPDADDPVMLYDGRYSSAVARLRNTFDVVINNGERRSEFHILHIRDLDSASGESPDGIASIYYRRITPRYELTLLDELVDVSRITLSNVQLRGLHLKKGALEVHAGYASPTMYDDLFLPVDRRWAAGAGYSIDVRSTRLTPSLYGFFSHPDGTEARRGVVGALSAEHRSGETLFMRGEIGVSRSLAAAGELRYTSARGQIRASVSHKSENFPTVGLADATGTHVEIDAGYRSTDRLSLTSRGTYDRLHLAALPQTIGAAGAGFRYLLTTRLSLLGGVDATTVRSLTTSIRTIGLPLGAAYDAPAFGLAASWRLLDDSTTSRRGDALRLSTRGSRGRLNASAWVERQRNAPTLELIFRDAPGLDLALLRLGIAVRNPEDVARALRDNAALIDLGFITGVNVNLTPRRLQAGMNLGWLGSEQRDQLRLLAVYSRDEGISATRDSMIATLTYSRRIFAATDLYGSFSSWRTNAGALRDSRSSIDVGLRQQFNGLPSFLRRSGTIEGFAFLDPNMGGIRTAETTPLAEIIVTLDGTRTARTDSRGAYAFQHVSRGPHQIAAQLPDSPRAFFTTPSHSTTKVAAHVDFGLVWAAARIDGRLINEAGTGIPNAHFSAVALNGVPISARSDAEGRFVFAVPPGTFRIVLAPESLPAGYTIAGELERSGLAETDRPQSISFEAAARRSIGGRAHGAAEVLIESLRRRAPVDAAGNFVFRSMPAGTFTLTAISSGHVVSRTVTLPSGPAMIDDVDLSGSAAQ
jgi:hypothetical protein